MDFRGRSWDPIDRTWQWQGKDAERFRRSHHNKKEMEHEDETIVLNINAADKAEFVQDYRDAVLETMMLICERRELDLGEDQLYALYTLAHSARKMGLKKN